MIVYNGYLKIDKVQIELKDGRKAVREILKVKNSVGVLCRIVGTENYLLVRQFRAPVNRHVLEIVAGGVEDFESPVEAAKREVEEELGRKVLDIKGLLTTLSSPGITTERIFLFSAVVSNIADKQKLDDTEEIKIEKYTRSELKTLVENDRIHDSKTLISILKELF